MRWFLWFGELIPSMKSWRNKMSNPIRLSICIVVYNQSAYIGKCLDRLLDQKVDFRYEIIVGDDCSTDSTGDILREYAKSHPEIIRVLRHDKNVGPFDNYRLTHLAARGEYVAHLDGDDFALPGKLKRQVEFLDRRKNCSGVFHILDMVDQQGGGKGRCWPESAPETFDLQYLVLNHPIVGHSSLMYRRGLLNELLNGSGRFIDFRVYVLLASKGELGFISQSLGEYTVGVGISHGNSWVPEVMEAVDCAGTFGLVESVIKQAKSRHLFRAALNEFYRRRDSEFRELIVRSWSYGFSSISQVVFYLLRHAPGVIRFIDVLRKRFSEWGLVSSKKMKFR